MVKAGTGKQSELWCLSRIGARQLFYAPINQVLPAATVTRWVETLLPNPLAPEALTALARQTGDPVRDLTPALVAQVVAKLRSLPNGDRLAAVIEGGEAEDERALDRIFGEELPSGLVLAEAES